MAIKGIPDGPIGGQSWAHAPRTMPWDRPAQFHELDDALDFAFRRLRNPVVSKKLLNLLDAGLPIDMVVEMQIEDGFMRGVYAAPLLLQMVPPLTVMLWRMAESADIQPKLSTDKDLRPVDFDPADMMAAEKRISNNTSELSEHANEISSKELRAPNMADRQGFMRFRPKAKSTR
jgi:hypothetical protein